MHPEVRRGLVISERASSIRSLAVAFASPIAAFPGRRLRRHCARPGSRSARPDAGSIAGRSVRPSSARQRRSSRRRAYLGRRWPTVKLKSSPGSRRGVADRLPAEWDALAGPAIPSSVTPSCRYSKDRAASAMAPAGRRCRSWSSARAASPRRRPAYLKTHSQGEYVFDHGWAEAWERAGGSYYPKLQVAGPVHALRRAAAAG